MVEAYKQLSQLYGSMLVQEFIPNGGEFGIYVLMNDDSEPRAYTAQRRIRSYPYYGGPSTLRETFQDEVSERAKGIAFSLLKAMKWRGVAMVEFRIDPRDNTPKLMEVNPRFWGSLQLSILSGVDFPWLYYTMLREGDVKPVMSYKSNVECRWLLPGDILWYVTTPGKLKNLPEFLRWKNNYDILSIEDPGPTIGFFLATVRYLFDKEMWNLVMRR
jgi:predicted ATP-grasp superfamily ATP-dependent carboligase